jgi:hypothetical protein
MTATPFALISTEDRSKIFAFGLDIDLPSGREVITFRRDPTGRSMFGVHQSAESARQRFSIITPLELVWQPDCRCRLRPTEDNPGNDGTCSPGLSPAASPKTDVLPHPPHNADQHTQDT